MSFSDSSDEEYYDYNYDTDETLNMSKAKIEKGKREKREYVKVTTMSDNEEFVDISKKVKEKNDKKVSKDKGKGKKVKESFIKDKESVKTIEDDPQDRYEMTPLHEKFEPIDNDSKGFEKVSDKKAIKELNIYRKKWLEKADVKDPIERVMRLVYKNYELNEDTITMKKVKDSTMKELAKVFAIFIQFRKSNLLAQRDERSELTYGHILNKIFEILYYSEKVVKYQYRMKMVLDPDYDYSMNDNVDAIDRFRAIEADKNTPYQNMLLLLLAELFEKRYRRFNGSCYKQVFNEDGYFTYSWKEAMTIDEFVYAFSSTANYANFHNATSNKGNVSESIKFLKTCREQQFPDLKKNRHVFSFRNGVYIAKHKEKGSDKVTDRFYKYGTKPPLPSTYVACKYFDLEFDNFDEVDDWYDIPTPNFQKILDYQFNKNPECKDICKWMYIFIGKLMYELKECDRWQIMPYLLGIAKSGKCFSPDTMIMLSDGNVKKVQDIKVGDKIMGDDSTPRTVLGTTKGYDKMYNVTSNKGETYTVNGPHILSLKYTCSDYIGYDKTMKKYAIHWMSKSELRRKCKVFYDKKYGSKEKAYEEAVKAMEEVKRSEDYMEKGTVIDISVEDYLKLNKHYAKEFMGYKVAIDFPEIEVDIDPYLIGYWLGDGDSAGPQITTADKEIVNYFINYMKEFDLEFNFKGNYHYSIRGKNNHVRDVLKRYNLIKNKHIPYDFKCNSRENRLKLLAGLIDSDGHMKKGNTCYEVIQKSKGLMEDIVYLCRSLGFMAFMKECEKTCTNSKNGPVTGTYWRVHISGDGIEDIPVKLERKKAKRGKLRKNVLVSKITVTEAGEGEYYGFQVDGNQRFVMGDFTVTHNSKISEVISNIYDTDDVATIENTTEKQFGLGPHKDKYILVMSELKRDFNMDQAIFQKMISGEYLTLAVKYGNPVKVLWKSPGFICSNEFPNFGDSQGSISRRFVVFSFERQVNDDDCDPQLDLKLEQEMAAIIKKCNRGYLEIVNTVGKKDVWKLLPKYFSETRDNLSNETNPLKHFLSSSRVEYGEENIIKLVDFKREFFEYCRQNNLQKPRWNDSVYKEPFTVFSYKKNVEIQIRTNVRNPETKRILTTPCVVGLKLVSDEIEMEEEKEVEL